MSGAFAGERAVVLGLGVAGTAAARALAEEGAQVRVSESRANVEVPRALRELDVVVLAGGHAPEHLQDATLVVASPGIPPHAPVMAWVRERDLPLWGELELGARLVRAPYVAVTGTNGKTTTTGMIAACLRAAGIDAIACGNIGHPFPTAAREPHEVLVVESSSFQLHLQRSFHPRVSVLLNLAPDHLDWHGSFEAYANAKARVFANQTPEDVHVGARDDEAAAAVSRGAPCGVRWFTSGEPRPGEVGYEAGDLVADGTLRIASPTPGSVALRADAAAAAAACLAFGIDARSIETGLRSFVPARHRGETVATAGGVEFVDDSKATNPHAAAAAVGDLTDVVLIAGGRAKGVDLAPLGALAPHLAGVVAIGEAADEVVATFQGTVATRKAGSIEEAVRTAFEAAPSGGTVLLAPACASWDMFRDYEERGERFAAEARRIEEEVREP